MKKYKYHAIIIILLLFIIVAFKITQSADPVWKANAKQLSSAFDVISGKSATIDNLADFIPFEWDTLYSFAPYTPEETIYEVIGYKWGNISSTVNEGMNQVVFLKDSKVICYIDGYPDKYNVFFVFGQYNFIKLKHTDKLAFNMSVTEDGIRIFEYDGQCE